MEIKNPKILYHSFNQDLSYFLVGTKEGCRVFQSNPFRRGFDLSKFFFYFIIILFILFKNRNQR